MKRIIVACFVFVALACASLAYAGPSDKPPTKESLQAAWEKVQKDDASTIKLEKTSDNDKVYDFETNFFPYKGKLTILNLVVDKGGSYYYDEDDGGNADAGAYTGVVELELSGVDKDFKEKYQYSYFRWSRHNRLIYDDHTSKWYTREDWIAHKKLLRSVQEKPACAPTSGGQQGGARQDDMSTLVSTLVSWAPMLLLIGVWVVFARRMGGKQSTVQSRYTQLAEDNHALLKEILEVLKRKS